MSCKELAQHFKSSLETTSEEHAIVHVVLDRYNVSTSLKEKTRERRRGHLTSGIDYSCSGITPIRSSLKTFLASSKTKGSLTEYVATKIIDHFKTAGNFVIVSAQKGVECSDDSYPISLLETSQKEADTILVLMQSMLPV